MCAIFYAEPVNKTCRETFVMLNFVGKCIKFKVTKLYNMSTKPLGPKLILWTTKSYAITFPRGLNTGHKPESHSPELILFCQHQKYNCKNITMY